MWGPNGWLKALGAKDVAGAGAVHAMGGASGAISMTFFGHYTMRKGLVFQHANIPYSNYHAFL